MGKLEKVQHAATRVMLPHLDYEERLQDITTLQKLLLDISEIHFDKIAGDVSHPLHNSLTFNHCRASSHDHTTYKPRRATTHKRFKSFFQFFVSRNN